MNPSYFLLGSVKVFSDRESVTPLLNLCMYHCIPYSDFHWENDGVTMVFRLSEYKRMKMVADAKGIAYKVVEKRGLPIILGRYKYRFGIWIGLVIAAALVFFSHKIVWDIKITGNERMTGSEVRELLTKQGFGLGSYIPSVNTDKIENMIMIESDRIAWMSINIIGTTANVEIRENVTANEGEDTKKPANLIASKSGIIEEVRIFRGKVMVGAGKYVNKGELLVSGLYDSVQEGFRYTRASGEVLARTVEEIYIEIPYEYEEKRYTGAEYFDKYLIFFDYSMNIYKNGGKEGALYDKINIVENCSLFGMVETPFSIKTVKYLEYEAVSASRSTAAAQELAYFELERRLSDISSDAIMIKKTVTPHVRDDKFVLYCTVVLIENIAQTSEFEVDLTG